jgi:TRAP-type C4-dicarboxylate transport system permease small subunit
MSIYKKIVRGLCAFFEALAALSLLGMVVIVTYQVVMRYFFNKAPGWSEELARQLMIFFSFIAMMIGVRDKLHICVTIFVERGLKKLLLPIEIFGKILIVVLGIMMSAFMGPYFSKLKDNILPATGIPVGFEYLMPTAMAALMALVAIYQIYDHFKYGTDEHQAELEGKSELEQKEANAL